MLVDEIKQALFLLTVAGSLLAVPPAPAPGLFAVLPGLFAPGWGVLSVPAQAAIEATISKTSKIATTFFIFISPF
jgi:hypothetical protein